MSEAKAKYLAAKAAFEETFENCVIGPNTLLENTIVEAGSTVNASQC